MRELRRPRLVQAGLVLKRDSSTEIVSWRTGSRFEIGGQPGWAAWGTVGMS